MDAGDPPGDHRDPNRTPTNHGTRPEEQVHKPTPPPRTLPPIPPAFSFNLNTHTNPPNNQPTTPIKTKRRRLWSDDTETESEHSGGQDAELDDMPWSPSIPAGTPNVRSNEENALRANLQMHILQATSIARKIYSLTGKRAGKDSHIQTHTTNLFEAITGHQPSKYPSQHNTILEAIKTLTEEVNRIAAKVDKQPTQPQQAPPQPGLESSIHSPNNIQTQTYASKANPTYTQNKMQTNQIPNQHRDTAPTNPSKAHHPARIVICFDEPVPNSQRRDETTVIKDINSHLHQQGAPTHLKITAIKWNMQGNCIIFTRSDQRATEVLPYAANLPNIIAPGHNGQVREDKKWFKIEVTNVRTGASDFEGKGAYSPQTIHEHLRENNPEYAKLNVVMLPRWVRPESEIANQAYSSVVFAVDSFDQHAHLLRTTKTLAAFGRLTRIREWTDRPPITQCRRCWKFDHRTPECKNGVKCRICGEDHEEERHQNPQPSLEAQAMQIDTPIESHKPATCLNCKSAGLESTNHPANWSRCPERLRRIGDNKDRNQNTKKGNNRNKTDRSQRGKQSVPPTTNTNTNRYAPLEEPRPSIENILKNARDNNLNGITEADVRNQISVVQGIISSSC